MNRVANPETPSADDDFAALEDGLIGSDLGFDEFYQTFQQYEQEQ